MENYILGDTNSCIARKYVVCKYISFWELEIFTPSILDALESVLVEPVWAHQSSQYKHYSGPMYSALFGQDLTGVGLVLSIDDQSTLDITGLSPPAIGTPRGKQHSAYLVSPPNSFSVTHPLSVFIEFLTSHQQSG